MPGHPAAGLLRAAPLPGRAPPQALELQELTEIYVARGLPPELAREVAERLTDGDVIRAHARDELGARTRSRTLQRGPALAWRRGRVPRAAAGGQQAGP